MAIIQALSLVVLYMCQSATAIGGRPIYFVVCICTTSILHVRAVFYSCILSLNTYLQNTP